MVDEESTPIEDGLPLTGHSSIEIDTLRKLWDLKKKQLKAEDYVCGRCGSTKCVFLDPCLELICLACAYD